jgi:hypothetical protein
MVADPSAPKITLICDFCGKPDTEVKRMFAGTRWDGREHTLCNECFFVCVSIIIYEDREWFEKEVEKIKARQRDA